MRVKLRVIERRKHIQHLRKAYRPLGQVIIVGKVAGTEEYELVDIVPQL